MDKLPNYRTDFRSIRDEVTPEEWRARVELAALHRPGGHRAPGPEHHILINLYGLLYKEITASSLAKIDLDGNVIWKPDTDYYVNKAGWAPVLQTGKRYTFSRFSYDLFVRQRTYRAGHRAYAGFTATVRYLVFDIRSGSASPFAACWASAGNQGERNECGEAQFHVQQRAGCAACPDLSGTAHRP